MRVQYLGEVVRQRRKALGISQELVCEGLCTAMTLSRFECGQQTPSWDCVTAILQRLGLPDDRYYAQLTRPETQRILLRKEILTYCGQFEQALGEARRQACTKAMEKQDRLERSIKKDDRINRQFVLGVQAVLGAHSCRKRLEMLMEAIRLTSPRFEVDEISSCLYSTNEIALINQIAVSYSLCGQRRTAIDIYRPLWKLLQKRTPNHSYLPLTAYNYARELGLEKRFPESLEIAELGRKVCISQEHYHLLPGFLHIEAECHFFMGDTDRSAELYRSAYYIYGATANWRDQEVLKAEAEERIKSGR